MVLHALAVDPLEKGKGCGRAFVAFYEDYAKQHGCTALRMDTNVFYPYENIILMILK